MKNKLIQLCSHIASKIYKKLKKILYNHKEMWYNITKYIITPLSCVRILRRKNNEHFS